MYKKYEMEYTGRKLELEFGKYANQTNSSVMLKFGATQVLATIVASKEAKTDLDFFPLSVDYQERLYAVGKIPGGYNKREGRPTDKAILNARAIDRPLRPFFPKNLRNDVVISLLVLSSDYNHSPLVAGMLASMIVSMVSDIPFNGPLGAVEVGYIDDEIILNPTEEEKQKSKLHLTLAGNTSKITMIESLAYEIPNDIMLKCIKKGHEEIIKICNMFNDIALEIGKEKFEIPTEQFKKYEEMEKFVYSKYAQQIQDILLENGKNKQNLDAEIQNIVEKIYLENFDFEISDIEINKENLDKKINYLKENGLNDKYYIDNILKTKEYIKCIKEAVTQVEKKIVKTLITEKNTRVDGRLDNEVRELSSEVGLIPRVHGTGLFNRGETQVLTIATLGKLSEEQRLDGLDLEETKRYMHQYNFPGFSVGEAKPSRGAGRREIGHGALAEKALIPVLPSKEEFPYTMRLVSEVLGSNGSTSQGAICASTLALMDAGVPIKKMVAGISTGLFTRKDGTYQMVTDIQGIEDFFGEMDFKVAGTLDGITAIQVDIKNDGLSLEVIEEALDRTYTARKMIIEDVMKKAISEPRKELSKYAPKISQFKIPVDKIRDVIGTGGKTITKIIEDTGVEIDIQEDGTILIYGIDQEQQNRAIQMIEILTKEYEVGDITKGLVTKITTFGAFVDLGGGKEGLLHKSQISKIRIENVEDVLKEEQLVTVKIIKKDEDGKLALSMKEISQ